MAGVIETSQLTKFYGAHAGLQDLDLDIRQGEVFGLLGPNGAGKTTTIRLLLDFIKPTRGAARVFGLDSQSESQQIRHRIGYLPGEFISYPNLTAAQVLEYFTNLRGGKPQSDRESLIERFRLDPSRKFGELSRGNRQKVGLAQAYMGNPELVVLDEPSGGLDPFLQIEFQELVMERKEAGVTQFISSHMLPEVEAICERVGIIRDGRLVALETIEALRARARAIVHIVVEDGSTTQAVEAFRNIPEVDEVNVEDGRITVRYSGEVDSIIKVAAQFTVTSFESRPPALDEVFMAYYNGELAAPETAAG